MEQVITFEDRYGDVFVMETNRSDCRDCAFNEDIISCKDSGNQCLHNAGVWVKD